MEKQTVKAFKCELCNTKFEALVHKYEAPACPKCRDSEWIIRADYPTPYYGMD